MCLQKLGRVRDNARLFHLVGNGISTVRLNRVVSPVPEIRSDSLPRLQSWNRTCMS